MHLPTLHRYATRTGLFPTADGGADAVVWSDTASCVWLSVIEDPLAPSVFSPESLTYDRIDEDAFFEAARSNPVVSRLCNGVRETLLRMTGPDYGKWLIHVPKIWQGMRYGYRADGNWDPAHGLLFNPRKFLIDPCAKGLEGEAVYGPALFPYQVTATTTADGSMVLQGNPLGERSTIDSLGQVPFSVAVDSYAATQKQPDDSHPHVSWARTLIYELHVKGFTKNAPWLPKDLRGTYAGLGHPATISYLKRLGITTVELLPICAKLTEPGIANHGRRNYWGYSTLNYFSPEPSYATHAAQEKGAAAVRQEVIDMVRHLHEAGLEVLLDMVYNHSCEGGPDGYSVSWRGLNGSNYYRRESSDRARLIDTTGTGNSFDLTNPNVLSTARDSLRYWAKRIGVDGFRFDLAVSLARIDDSFTPYHPFLYALKTDPILGNLKLIMEPWDLGPGGWQTGHFGMPFSEWNDRFRDSVRRFWLTDTARISNGIVPEIGMQEMATRLFGSSDLFASEPGRGAAASINFVTAHDGFTLCDLTRYASKHNERNGEGNMDGNNTNYSTNFGTEGPSNDPAIDEARQRAALGLMGTLLLSMGTPMIQSGDEFGRTQQGNNNAYCQDNEISWADWSWMRTQPDSWQHRRYEAIRRLIHIRRHLPQFHHHAFYTLTSQLGLFRPTSQVQWYLPDGTAPTDANWFNTSQRQLIMRVLGHELNDILVVINGAANDTRYLLPHDTGWRLLWTSVPVQMARPERLDTGEADARRSDGFSNGARLADLVPEGDLRDPDGMNLRAEGIDGDGDGDADERIETAPLRSADIANPNEKVGIPAYSISCWEQTH